MRFAFIDRGNDDLTSVTERAFKLTVGDFVEIEILEPCLDIGAGPPIT